MQISEQIAELAAALALAQGVIEGAAKDKMNPAFRAKYADLASVWDACRGPLSSNGLSIVQAPGEAANRTVAMTTYLLHKSGQWMRSELTIPLANIDAQGYGSALTYARRYALSAMVGIAPEDDDGNAAAGSNARDGAANNAPARTMQQKAAAVPEDFDAGAAGFDVEAELRKATDKPTLDAAWRANKGTIARIKTAQPEIHAALLKTFANVAETFGAKAPAQ